MISHRLRHRVDIQSQQHTQSQTTGAITTTWVNYMSSVPAEVLTGPGREQMIAGTKIADTDARIMMRWFPGLDQSMRILWDGKIYNILTFDTDRTGRMEYRVRAQEGLNDGQ